MFARAVLAALSLACLSASAEIRAVTRFRSPKNADRRVRPSTELIVLHTTEAPAKGSLKHLSERGECHYCVTEDGTVYQIVDLHRVAFHAGRSMWNGRENVDDFSVGIECVGYHDRPMPEAQLKAIASLVAELRAKYSIPEWKVLTHSQVAYDAPNKWHKNRHRGRKRCGMLFAMPSVRRLLGLKMRPAYDPDVKARRLAVGDEYLAGVLFGRTDTMLSRYGRAAIENVDPVRGPRKPAPAPAKPTQKFRQVPQNVADLKRQGYVSIGSITKKNLPARVAGDKWNAPDTYYTIRSRVIPGNILDPKHVEEGMNVWRKKSQPKKP